MLVVKHRPDALAISTHILAGLIGQQAQKVVGASVSGSMLVFMFR